MSYHVYYEGLLDLFLNIMIYIFNSVKDNIMYSTNKSSSPFVGVVVYYEGFLDLFLNIMIYIFNSVKDNIMYSTNKSSSPFVGVVVYYGFVYYKALFQNFLIVKCETF